jgi:hypothetical protein
MKTKIILLSLIAASLSACATTSNLLNPFYEPPSAVALLGQPNDHALNDSTQKVDTARQALDAMASYQRAHYPQPANPVIQPSVVRLMWIPDHLNRNGDLVPAHYYYMKVLDDRFAVTDAFELEAQLGDASGYQGNATHIPFVHSDEVRGR